MNTKRYVQHISGQGDKWHVHDEGPYSWEVRKPYCYTFEVPKSEYRLCDPPEEWEDVSGSYEAYQVPDDVLHYSDLRLRKIDHLHNGPCFIVERKKS